MYVGIVQMEVPGFRAAICVCLHGGQSACVRALEYTISYIYFIY